MRYESIAKSLINNKHWMSSQANTEIFNSLLNHKIDKLMQ